MTRLLTILLILVFKFSSSQKLSTVFVDSIAVTLDNKKIFSSYSTKIYYLLNDRDTQLVIYNDKKHRVELSFKSYNTSKSKKPPTDRKSDPNKFTYLGRYGSAKLFVSNSWQTLSPVTSSYDGASYCDMDLNKDLIKSDSTIQEKVIIEVVYRLTNMAPADTLNYTNRTREGVWVASDDGVEKILISYKNNNKDGSAKAYYKDGSIYEAIFLDGKKTKDGDFIKRTKTKLRFIPYLLVEDCTNEKKL